MFTALWNFFHTHLCYRSSKDTNRCQSKNMFEILNASIDPDKNIRKSSLSSPCQATKNEEAKRDTWPAIFTHNIPLAVVFFIAALLFFHLYVSEESNKI